MFFYLFHGENSWNINFKRSQGTGDGVLGENLLTAFSSELAAAGKRLPDTQEKESEWGVKKARLDDGEGGTKLVSTKGREHGFSFSILHLRLGSKIARCMYGYVAYKHLEPFA